MANDVELLGLYRSQFERAKANQRAVLWIQVVVAVSSVIGVFVPSSGVTYLLSALALAGGAWSILVNLRASELKSSADRARRAHTLSVGLGLELSGKARSDVLRNLDLDEVERVKWEDPYYFDSSSEVGPRKLLDLIQESAFWSTELFKVNARRKWSQFALALAGTLLLLVGFPFLPDQRAIITAAQVLCLGLTFLVTRDLVSRAHSFSQASHSTERIDDRLERMRSGEILLQDVLVAFGDYNSIVESTPMIESGLYRSERARLSALWKSRHSA